MSASEFIAWQHGSQPTLLYLFPFFEKYKLPEQDIKSLIENPDVADFFECVVRSAPKETPHIIATWITGEIFGWLRSTGKTFDKITLSPESLGELITLVKEGHINLPSGKAVLVDMLNSGEQARDIIRSKGLEQVSDSDTISRIVTNVLEAHPEELEKYIHGKEGLAN